MRQIIALAIAAAVTLAAETAAGAEKIAGIWKLQSWEAEEVETKERSVVFGDQPNGFLILTPEGHLMGLLTAQGRKPPQNEAERSMLAYSGRYRVEGDKFVTKVDVAWNKTWVGTEQARDYKIDGNRLVAMSPPGRTRP